MASLSAVLSSFTPLARRRTWSCLSGVLHQQRQVSNAQGTAPMQFDLVVVGGGIVGCATARQMKIAHPNISVAVVEKENILAPHQSGHNSGVVHAGIYYLPGSLKAKLCVQGMQLAYEYFDKHKIPYKKIGKLIVAVEQIEVARLQAIFERATKNECKDIEMISGDRIKDYEPYCKGLQALWSPHTGIVDWGLVTNSFAENFEERGGKVFINYPVQSLGLAGESGDAKQRENTHPVAIGSTVNLPQLRCKWVITCAGLQADRISELSGCSPLPKIVPFRGEYLMLKPEKRYLVKGNIYPVPDPRFPFLGVHFTPRMNGDVWLGPNAVLAYKREGYSYFDISIKDLWESLTFSGMQRLMYKYTTFGATEMYRGIFAGAQVRQLQRFMPDLKRSDIIRGPAGVRAQALDAQGNLVDDFVFDGGEGALGSRVLHVRNAPSPAATSSLAIAQMIAETATQKFGL